ncbi:MAG: hypothetical protein IJJ70_05315 [Treponema sp.]|nr:hypothetical protein [Treponema sp.]
MKMEFNSWTDYDDWLIQNYNDFAITSVNEVDGKIVVEYMNKADWDVQQKGK